MVIQILGGGCAKCSHLEALTADALKELELSTRIEKITDFDKISGMGVMSTPALVINGEIKSSGKNLTKDQIKKMILESAGH